MFIMVKMNSLEKKMLAKVAGVTLGIALLAGGSKYICNKATESGKSVYEWVTSDFVGNLFPQSDSERDY